MYDGLTGQYTFACPTTGEAHVSLSAFRSLERLPGTAHPAVYRIVFACRCGREHDGLVTHAELDWAPLAGARAEFFNVMTRRFEASALELLDRAAGRIRAGEWPWSFFCYPEDRPRPVFPSAFHLLAPAEDHVGVGVRCPACTRLSLNVVTVRHVDEPFYSDPRVGVVEHLFERTSEPGGTTLRDDLASARSRARFRSL